jgi:hypothetical protein
MTAGAQVLGPSDGYGIEGLTADDHAYTGSRFIAVRNAIFANPYQNVWGGPGEQPFPRFRASLWKLMPYALPWRFLAAARRTVGSHSDLRWGSDRRGYQRLLHPNGICLTGMWEITADTPYSGYFRKGSRGLVVARYSTCCSETRSGNTRSLAMVGSVYPTTDPNHHDPLPTASFITQEDLGGAKSRSINEAVLRNAPDTSAFRRGWGLPILLTTGLVLKLTDKQQTFRQIYQIAELGKPAGEPTRAPEFMQLTVASDQPMLATDGMDFRDEIMAQIYDRGDALPRRTLTFRIETTDHGITKGNPLKERRTFQDWKDIGTLTFDAAVASYNGDHVYHLNHPPWRDDRNNAATARVR